MESKNNPWKVLESKSVYENNWISVEHNSVLNAANNKGVYGVVHFKNIAVGVIPIDNEGNTWIVGQHRFPLNCYSWEIPEGGCPINTSPLETAKRELKEETGIVAKEWSELLKIHTSNSVCNEVGYIYIAKCLTFEESQPEEDEQLEIKKIPFEKLFQMAMNGEITDSLSLAGIFKLKHLLEKS